MNNPLLKKAEINFNENDFPEEKKRYYEQRKSKEEITVRAIYVGKSETAKKQRFIQMKFALNFKLLQHASFEISDPNFEEKLLLYSKAEGIPIEKINRTHIKKI